MRLADSQSFCHHLFKLKNARKIVAVSLWGDDDVTLTVECSERDVYEEDRVHFDECSDTSTYQPEEDYGSDATDDVTTQASTSTTQDVVEPSVDSNEETPGSAEEISGNDSGDNGPPTATSL